MNQRRIKEESKKNQSRIKEESLKSDKSTKLVVLPTSLMSFLHHTKMHIMFVDVLMSIFMFVDLSWCWILCLMLDVCWCRWENPNHKVASGSSLKGGRDDDVAPSRQLKPGIAFGFWWILMFWNSEILMNWKTMESAPCKNLPVIDIWTRGAAIVCVHEVAGSLNNHVSVGICRI